MAETINCPWCAEEIRAEAKKCKHCGEFLVAERTSGSNTSGAELSPSATGIPDDDEAVWKFHGFMWRCCAHDKAMCATCTARVRPPTKPGRKGDVYPPVGVPAQPSRATTGGGFGRPTLSQVGQRPDGGVACPKCGGTQFTAKRSKKGKAIGFATLGVGGLVAPKSQVKCVVCGEMFKRG